jgi:hypothetical protein
MPRQSAYVQIKTALHRKTFNDLQKLAKARGVSISQIVAWSIGQLSPYAPSCARITQDDSEPGDQTGRYRLGTELYLAIRERARAEPLPISPSAWLRRELTKLLGLDKPETTAGQ